MQMQCNLFICWHERNECHIQHYPAGCELRPGRATYCTSTHDFLSPSPWPQNRADRILLDPGTQGTGIVTMHEKSRLHQHTPSASIWDIYNSNEDDDDQGKAACTSNPIRRLIGITSCSLDLPSEYTHTFGHNHANQSRMMRPAERQRSIPHGQNAVLLHDLCHQESAVAPQPSPWPTH